ncbi:MAG: Wzz/FepE/Etk N-terminal domain-containing protein [Candidatus Omnitrophica bacterium]|nr:Wzz/FepE/Etk N-terminal domain-containing protein [Candidatus Omnitrophota bacterium]MCM8827987.1 Wzz/FepE/Etk N-terminal domain-containing protein [Candidatus Omnitrophota bacterium]
MEKISRNQRVIGSFKRHILNIFLLLILGILLGILYYFFSPKYYKATAAILKPIGNIETLDIATKSKTTDRQDTGTELFMSILTSRRMYDDIIEKFNLSSVYGSANLDRVREILQTSCWVSASSQRVISISVIDRDSQRAADIANFFWKNLDRLLQEMTITTAKKNRMFIEERLVNTGKTLEQLQQQLNQLQQENKLLAIKDTGEISALATELMTKLSEKKLELERVKRIYQPDQPEVVLLAAEIKDLQKELDRLTSYQAKLAQILRELKAQESVYSFLTGQLETAKLDETKNTPFIQVLDTAVPPQKVYSPDIKKILIVISLLILGIGVIVLFFDVLRFLGSI